MTMQPGQRQFSIRYSIAAMIVLLLIQAHFFAPHPETLAYSDFIKLAKAGKVSDVTLSNQAIAGTLAANGLEAFLPKEKLEELPTSFSRIHSVPNLVKASAGVIRDRMTMPAGALGVSSPRIRGAPQSEVDNREFLGSPVAIRAGQIQRAPQAQTDARGTGQSRVGLSLESESSISSS